MFERASLYDFLGDMVVYRNLAPADEHLRSRDAVTASLLSPPPPQSGERGGAFLAKQSLPTPRISCASWARPKPCALSIA